MDSRRAVEAQVKRTHKPWRPVHARTIDRDTTTIMSAPQKFPMKSKASKKSASILDDRHNVNLNAKSAPAPELGSSKGERHYKSTTSTPLFVLNELRDRYVPSKDELLDSGKRATSSISRGLLGTNEDDKESNRRSKSLPIAREYDDVSENSESDVTEYGRKVPIPPPPTPPQVAGRRVLSGPASSELLAEIRSRQGLNRGGGGYHPPADVLAEIRATRNSSPDEGYTVGKEKVMMTEEEDEVVDEEQQRLRLKLLRSLSSDDVLSTDDGVDEPSTDSSTAHQAHAETSRERTFGGLSAPPEILARGSRARRAYAQAARDGTKKVYRTRLMLVGQERVGKTSLKKSLTGQGFDKHEAITDGVEATDSCEINIEVAKAGGKVWSINKTRETKDDEYTKALADEIAKRLIINTSEESNTSPPTPDKIDETSAHTQQEEPAGAALPMPPTPGDVTVPAQITSLVEKMITEQVRLKAAEKDGDNGGANSDAVSLSIWDFAGHDVYYTTHQVFLTWRAVYVIVFDLSRDLDSIVPPDSRDGFYEAAKGNSKSELTCLQFINFWLSSIFAHAVAPPSVANKNTSSKTLQKSPPIFIVGTHRESLLGDAIQKKKTVDEAFHKIRKIVKKKPFECHVIPRYYAVENSLEDNDEELIELRRHIERVAAEEPYMGEEIPLRWLLFEEALKADQFNFMTLDQTKDLTRPVGMETERELLTMLTFYHDLGYVVYFGDLEDHQSLLRDIVILNPQWLINVFKQVITILDPTQRDGIVNDAWTRLEDEGILEDRLIQHMWQGFLEQKDALVQIMAKFDLICESPVTDSPESPESPPSPSMSDDERESSPRERSAMRKCFYVPSRLTPRCSNEEIGQIETSIDFYVDFRGFLPDGLFHRLMARAVRWMAESDGPPVFLFYRQISLMLDEDHQALLDMLPPNEATIKVTIFRSVVADLDEQELSDDDDGPPDPSVVNKLMTFVTDTLSNLRRNWAKRIQYDVCFACPKCKKRKAFKECIGKKSLRCGFHAINAASVRAKYGMQVPGMTSGENRPKTCRKAKEILCDIYLSDLACKIGAEWQSLGIRLGLKQADIDHIVENKSQAIDRILAMLVMWRQRNSVKGNQQQLIDELCGALCASSRTDLSDDIKSDASVS